MQDEPHRQVETLFDAARSRAAGPEREAYLDGACGQDAALRARVEALLEADAEASGFLESPALDPAREGPGSSIGDYKLLQEIGEGGMGVVYMAEQQRPVHRKVALKVIKLGMDTKQVIARFEAERQALAMMDHPHIARVFDAGSTDTGRPYFVMELVRGVPIHLYCDTHKLSTEERLGLFVEVCRAVQHAHQKGIIHRDLKPTNVLVTSHDGTPVPKIIDFGVAKATNQRLTERTLFTEFQQIVGTPEYMSPEQAEMSGLDVDTRSDIYALGVLMYQLLTGTTPVDSTALRTAGFEEMTRMIREDEPPAPSTRISKLGDDADTIARHRRSDAGSLSKLIRGDLDWIVMKALEKDRTRRYETASAFAEDVVRHLESRPVEAGPPGALYRLGKFAHRNKKAVVAALVLTAVFGLGLAGTTAGFLRASGEAERSGRVSDSLQQVLAMTDRGRAADRLEVEAVLETVREVFGEQHATYAAVLDTLSQRLHDAGEFDAAAELCREALAVWRTLYGEQHPNVGASLAQLGATLRARGDDEGAEEALRSALATLDGAANAPGLMGYDARMQLAELLGNRGDYEEADALYGESLAILRASPSPVHFRIIQTLEGRALLQIEQSSEGMLETVQAMYDETHLFYPDGSPALGTTALALGRQLVQRREPEAAEPYLREALRRFRAADEPPRIYLLGAYDLLFQIVRGREDAASVVEADELLRELILVAQDIWSLDDTAANQKYYANRMLDRGLFVDALTALLEAHSAFVDGGRTVDERENLRDNVTMMAFRLAVRSDQDAESHAFGRDAVERMLAEEPEHPAILFVLGALRYRLGEFALALETFERLGQPLSEIRGGLARRMSPGDHAFRAMAYARLEDGANADAELAAMRAALEGQELDDEELVFMREVEAVVQSAPSASENG